MLAVATYNTLNVKCNDRYIDICDQIRTHVIAMQGTGIKKDPMETSSYSTKHINDSYSVVQWGYGKGNSTNKSAGVSIAYRRDTWKAHEVIMIDSPPTELQGRAGMIRLKSYRFDIAIYCAYMPPYLPGRRGQQALRTTKMILEWISGHMQKLPSRTTPILLGDFNSDLKLDPNREDTNKLVNSHGKAVEEMIDLMGLMVFPGRRWAPTYFGNQNNYSRIDHIIAPRGVRHTHAVTRTMNEAARRLQLIPASGHRDHIPVKACWKMGIRYRRHQRGPERLPRLDDQRLAVAVQTGEGRAPFLREVLHRLRETLPALIEV